MIQEKGHWETDAEDLIEHLKMQVAHIINTAISGGGIAGKYSVKPGEEVLDSTARGIFRRKPSKLTVRRAEEIAAANREKEKSQ